LRYHLDTSFLVDWQRRESTTRSLVNEIMDGEHRVSIDAVAHTEFMAARVITPRKELIVDTALTLGRFLEISVQASTRAAEWLSPMDKAQRRAFFADAIIAAVALEAGATLLTGDRVAAAMFPVDVHMYR
jgi:predicted nucleic acid-binding protein